MAPPPADATKQPDTADVPADEPTRPQPQPFEQGLASWYGGKFHGRRTASGERYDMHALTAAHKTLPFGTLVRVRSVHTGQEVVVRINDRGPYRRQRIIDLSLGAISALGLRHRGVTEVVLLRE
jgi:rare lipoprotein A